jgi:3-oxoacyl-[acyl-carrier-protein] synthase II
MSTRRVVITGIGLITPIGIGIQKFWDAAVRGTNGVLAIDAFDTADFKTKTGGEVKNFKASDYLPSEVIPRMDRSSQFATAAAMMAVADSGLTFEGIDPFRIGVSLGTTMGEPQVLERGIDIKYKTSSAEQIPAALPSQYPCAVIPENVARLFGIKGQTIMIPTACAAGNYAIGYAFDLIRMGRLDLALSGGSDPLSKIAFTGFNRLLATTKDVCRPFDKRRDGMAVGEGAAILVIEELSRAVRRGAQIYAEILGYGLGCDAFKMTIPDPTGSGGIIALERALKNAGTPADKVDYISAHGTGTGENDKTETLIIKSVLGEHALRTPVSSIKSMIGHTMGAASAIEAAASALMIRNKAILPTAHWEERDPDCDLDYVPNTAREADVGIVVSNAYAFGGNTSSLVLGRFNA